MKRFIMIVALFALTGCGDPVSLVKGGTINSHAGTTVGNAFDIFFNEPKWEAKTSENKTQFVDFSGKAKTPIPLELPFKYSQEFGSSSRGFIQIPANGMVKIQFIINKDDTFQIESAQAPLVTKPIGTGGFFIATLEDLLKASLIDSHVMNADGSSVPLKPDVVNSLLNHIYAGS